MMLTLTHRPIQLLIFMASAACVLFLGKAPPARASSSSPITVYQPRFQECRDASGKTLVALRSFVQGGRTHLLLVDPLTLMTSVGSVAAVACHDHPGRSAVADTPYLQALARYTSPPFRLQNYGVIHAEQPGAGYFLTVDLCPSRKPFERELFERLASMARPEQAGVPVAIAVSGDWLERHDGDVAWLKDKMREGRLALTWVNHSRHHPYDPALPLERNFLLGRDVDFSSEVIENERLLLERGLVPSPFFRFPGLVADGSLVGRLRELGLIPLGSDAWLAKGERPTPGSIILVHGNGNEPAGIRLLLPLLSGEVGRRLLPLSAAFGP